MNLVRLAYTTMLDLHIEKIDLRAQKINRSHLDTFGMVIAALSQMESSGKKFNSPMRAR